MAKAKITKDSVDAMAQGDVIWDSQMRGFGVRYRARDRVYLFKTRIHGVQRILTIGRHGKGAYTADSARREAQRLLGLVQDGKDPAAERDAEKRAPTLAAFAERFSEEYSSKHHKPRTRVEVAGLIKRYILPALGKMKLRDIGRAEVAKMHAQLHDTPIAANRALAVLSAMLG
jgi:hypothetical protein